MRELKAAVIGTGFIGAQHIEAVRRTPGVRLIAVADQNPDTARAVAERYQVGQSFTDYRELLDRADVDVVHVCTTNALHYPICKEAAARGKHLFCEKPLALCQEEAEELLRLIRDKRVAAAVDFNYRHNVMMREMRERVRNQGIGEILTVSASYLQDWMLFDTDYDWRLEAGAGGLSRALADIGSHCFDSLQFVCGRKIQAVYAKLVTVYPKRKKTVKAGGTFSTAAKAEPGKMAVQARSHTPEQAENQTPEQAENQSPEQAENQSPEEVDVTNEDAAFVMLEMEGGLLGVVHVSQISAGKKNAFSLSINGSRASLQWDQERGDRLVVGKREAGNEELFAGAEYLTEEGRRLSPLPAGHPVGWADGLTAGIKSFYHSIATHTYEEARQTYATFEDASYIMRIVEACMKSGREDRWVSIEEIR